ncbi:hypothetical protein RRG08_050444 [Elysia crispata]|uniref:Secreted protein n=1 Tax=Elysia crispata TaxID=231223 RepID=A0AAE0ZLD3_9GAST|nr:hypothetical protein RRG08_050444 [Elysia crispata]
MAKLLCIMGLPRLAVHHRVATCGCVSLGGYEWLCIVKWLRVAVHHKMATYDCVSSGGCKWLCTIRRLRLGVYRRVTCGYNSTESHQFQGVKQDHVNTDEHPLLLLTVNGPVIP